MFKKLLKFSLAAGIVGAGIFFAHDKLVFGKYSYAVVKAQGNEKEDEESGIGAMQDFFNLRRANPNTGIVDQNAVMAAYQKSSQMSFNKTGNGSLLKWTEMGPDNIGGRCRAVSGPRLLERSADSAQLKRSPICRFFRLWTGEPKSRLVCL